MVGWLFQLLLDLVRHLERIIGPIVWIRTLTNIGHDVLPIIINFFDFVHYFLSFRLVTQVREKLLDMWKLGYRNLVIKLLVIWAVVLVVLGNCLKSGVVRFTFDLFLLLLVLVKLELAARATRWEARKQVLFQGCGSRVRTSTLLLALRFVVNLTPSTRYWVGIILVLPESFIFDVDGSHKWTYLTLSPCSDCWFFTGINKNRCISV